MEKEKLRICWNITSECNSNCEYCHRFNVEKRTFNDKIMMIVNKNPKFSRLALEMLKGYKKNLYMSEEDFLIRASNYKSLKNRFYLLGKAVKSKVPMKLRINLIIKLLINGY